MELPPELAEAVLDGLADAVVVTDAEGMIAGWHGGAEGLLGFAAAEVLGRPVTDILAGVPTRDLLEVGTLGGAPAIELVSPVRRRRGPSLLAGISVRPLGGPGGPLGSVAVIKPMSAAMDPVRGPGRRRVNPAWDRTLGRIARGLVDAAAHEGASVEDTGSLAQLLVTQARAMMPDCELMLSLVPHDRQANFRIIAAAGSWAETLVGQEWRRAGTVAGRAMQERRAIETVRMREQSNLASRMAPGGILTGRLVPLWTRSPLPDGRDAIGVLGFYRAERRYFTPWERRQIGEFCRLASLMLQGAELRAAAERSADRLRDTVDAAYRFTGSLAGDEVLPALAAAGAPWGQVVIVLRVVEGEAAVLAATGPGSPPAGRRLALSALRAPGGTALVAHALELGRGVASPGLLIDGVEEADAAHLGALRSAACVPVAVIQGSAIAMVVGRGDPAPFGPDELGMLQTVASIGGVALRNAWLYGEVQEAARVKSDFLNMAAHELRTPLTVLRGYLSMLADGSFGPAPTRLRQPLALLESKTEELGRLVDDLLLAARLDSGRLAVNLAALDLQQAARRAVERAQGRARQLRADLRLEPARRPVVVFGDRDHVQQILDALVANALSYGGEAPPQVRVRLAVSHGYGRVEVEDRGRGVADGDRERIFERFARITDDRYAQEPGTGLGLYIARELAVRQQGALELERSGPDAGSLFVLSLPEVEATRDG